MKSNCSIGRLDKCNTTARTQSIDPYSCGTPSEDVNVNSCSFEEFARLYPKFAFKVSCSDFEKYPTVIKKYGNRFSLKTTSVRSPYTYYIERETEDGSKYFEEFKGYMLRVGHHYLSPSACSHGRIFEDAKDDTFHFQLLDNGDIRSISAPSTRVLTLKSVEVAKRISELKDIGMDDYEDVSDETFTISEKEFGMSSSRVDYLECLQGVTNLSQVSKALNSYRVRSENRAMVDRRSIKRTFSRLRETAYCNVIDPENVVWLTLTFATEKCDGFSGKDYWDAFRKFKQRLQRKVGKFDYIAVIEPHESGRFHFHCFFIFDGKAPYMPKNRDFFVEDRDTFTLEEVWGNGFVKVNEVKDDRVVEYLISYISDIPRDAHGKEIEDRRKAHKIEKGARLDLYPTGMRLYNCSRTIARPQSVKVRSLALAHKFVERCGGLMLSMFDTVAYTLDEVVENLSFGDFSFKDKIKNKYGREICLYKTICVGTLSAPRRTGEFIPRVLSITHTELYCGDYHYIDMNFDNIPESYKDNSFCSVKHKYLTVA